jgi:hypothetical protein
MNTVAKTYVASVGPEKAQQILNDYAYKGQRRFDKEKASKYARSMEKDHWVEGRSIVLAMTKEARQKRLIDGQHRLAAVVESGTTQRFVFIEYLADNDHDIARLYYTTDRNKIRTPGNIFKASGVMDDLGFSERKMNAAYRAAKFMESGFRHINSPMDEDDLLACVLVYQDAIVAYANAIDRASSRMTVALTRVAVMGVGIATFHYSSSVYGDDVVADFWNGVATDDGLLNSDPRKVALVHIRDTKMMGQGENDDRKRVSAALQARYVANCFNAWCEKREYVIPTGKSKGYSKVPDATAPIKILGTPWNGK